MEWAERSFYWFTILMVILFAMFCLYVAGQERKYAQHDQLKASQCIETHNNMVRNSHIFPKIP